MSDGGSVLHIKVHAAAREEAELLVQACDGKVVFNPPPPGPFAMDPGSDLEDLKNAIGILGLQAEEQLKKGRT